MLKINILLIIALFSYNIQAMNSSVECSVKIDFETSAQAGYLFTGYGQLICSDDSTPMTIFSAIRSNEINSELKGISKFTLTTSPEKFDVISYIFQTYKVKTSHNFLFLHYQGKSNFPTRTLGTIVEGEFKGTNNYESLINLLPESELIIEQDQFWPEEEI